MSYKDFATKRIAHVKAHIDNGFNIDQLVHNIENNLGNPVACLMTLSRHAEANAIYAWFGLNDINAMRHWSYVAAKLDQKWYQMEPDTASPGDKMLRLLKPLLSNDASLIEWFAHYDQVYDMVRVGNVKTHDFWAYQAVLALRGDWSKLVERCERIIADPPSAGVMQKYMIDHHYYLALARGDIDKMQDLLAQLVVPKTVKMRSDHDSGYAADLISTIPVIYTKIAWKHGYHVKVDSPYVPVEWLSVDPLEEYDATYNFLT